MKDALHTFGAITLSGGAGTVYSASELDLGTIDSRYTFRTLHYLGLTRDLAVEFIFTTALATGTSVQFFWSSDTTETSTTKILTGEVILTATGVLGYRYILPTPWKLLGRYNRVGAVIVGAMDAGIAYAALVQGPNLD